jgi:hypothetical protein
MGFSVWGGMLAVCNMAINVKHYPCTGRRPFGEGSAPGKKSSNDVSRFLAARGTALKNVEGSIMWWIGDWLRYGEQRKWGEKYTHAVEATGFDIGTLRNAKSLAGTFDLSRRRDNLSWSHHAEVAALDHDEQDALLNFAESEGWSQKELRRRVSQSKAAVAVSASAAG